MRARKAQALLEAEGFLSIEQMLEQAETNVTKSLTCNKCNMVCKDHERLKTHKDSRNCKKRQAEQKGEEFIDEGKILRTCEVCSVSVQNLGWGRHLDSVRHRENVRKQTEPAFQCTVCDKTFDANRPKQQLKRHLQRARHLAKARQPNMGYCHNAICRKHNFMGLVDCFKKGIKVI